MTRVRGWLIGLAVLVLGAFPVVAAEESATPGPLAQAYLKLFKERARNIELIRAYGEASRFTVNDDFPGELVPYFVDRHGSDCAVANLMRRGGHDELILAIVQANNNIRVREIKSGPALEWIRNSGMTQEEVARVQPSYEFKRPRPLPTFPKPEPMPLDPPSQQAISEVDRLREHFKRVEAELKASTYPSLEKALEILKPSIQEASQVRSAGFRVIPAGTTAETKSTFRIANDSAGAISFRVTFFDAKGNAVGPRLPADSPFRAGKGTVEPGKAAEVTYECKDTWVFVEWTSSSEITGQGVVLASPLLPDAAAIMSEKDLRKLERFERLEREAPGPRPAPSKDDERLPGRDGNDRRDIR